MAELDTLRDLENRTHLLSTPGDGPALRRNAWLFTRAAVLALGAGTWALVKAPPGGEQIEGVRIDKIIHRQSLEIVDIVFSAGASGQAPSWQLQGPGEAAWIVPVEPLGEVFRLEFEKGTGELHKTLDALGDELADLSQELPRNTEALARVASLLEQAIARVDALSASGIRVHL